MEIGRPVWLCASAAAINTFSSSGVIFPSLEPISAMIGFQLRAIDTLLNFIDHLLRQFLHAAGRHMFRENASW